MIDNLKYNWDEAKITNSQDGTETTIVPIVEKKKDNREFWEQRLYIYKTGEKDYKALVYEIVTNKYVPLKKHSIDGGDFTGFISVWDLKTGFVRAARFENNQVIETGVVEIIDYTTRNSTNKAPIEAPCIYADFGDGGCGGKSNGGTETTFNGGALREVPVSAPSKGSPVEYYGPRSPVIGGGDAGGYTSPGGGGASSGGGTAPNPIIQDASFSKNPCLAGLYSKLGGSPIFQSYLKKIDNDFSVADLKLAASTSLPDAVNGKTDPPINYIITITFNENTLSNKPALEIARTFIHEMIHAEMFKKLLYLASTNGAIDGGKLAEALNQHDYPVLYGYYTKYGIDGMQHQQMADLYRETIVSFLKGFDNTLTQAEYEALAWQGLQGTDAWNSKSVVDRMIIKDIYNNWLLKAKKNCQ
ncbi:hypothetical protein SAMN06265349_101343 [Flavobacterium resistens]|uniref:Uncharacterized protein n=1 Tax=Flavobacterium resistens TaxID=443612 RepID=A0A521ARN7_9FLAO|nr:hypothetical protein [Flavobacterium resistens]MRX68637.1 hypothetical protein [Flavobacterium resistens]SMO37503.1 hypothetical protein SAMN06265349_101343 [Flavobacterium resistens]